MGVRKTILPIIVSTLILATLGFSFEAFAENPNDQVPSEIHAPDRLIIKFNPGVSGEKQNSIISGQSANILNDLSIMNIKIIEVPENALDQVKEALSKNNDVAFAEYDVAAPPSIITNDTYSGAWHLSKINVYGAYDITKGGSNPVAILDSGIDFDHPDFIRPDLTSKIIYPYNGYTNLETGVEHQNGCGHGTPVAGSAAAVTNNGIGVAGVGWDTQIIPIKITNDAATGSTQCYGYSSGVLNGVNWAVQHNVRVVNLSYGFGSGSGSIDTAAQIMQDNGGWLVISAGNSGGNPGYQEDPTIINVSATTSSDAKASWSSYGNYVDFAAPGSGIWATIDGGSYGTVSGTSFSAPITSAVINLIFSSNPTLSAADAYNILATTAVDLGDLGWDEKFGHGRIDAYAAVLAASNTSESSPFADAQSISTVEDTPKVIALTASDPEDAPLTYSIVSGPSNGSLSGTVPNLTYTPNQDYVGSDSFTFKANNGTYDSNIATISITITPVNDAPVAAADSDNTFEDTAVTVNVLANDIDVDGDTLTVTNVTNASNGSVVINPDDTVTYTPNSDFVGGDYFTYTMSDGNGENDTAIVSITVNPTSKVHVGDLDITKSGKNNWTGRVTITVHQDNDTSFAGVNVAGDWSGGSSGTSNCVTDLLGQCQVTKKTRGDNLTFTVTGISGNSAEYVASYNHDPDEDCLGTSITIYKDGTNPGTNMPPVASDDSASTDEDTLIPILALLNDIDPDGDSFFISAFDDTSSSGASITDNGDGTFNYDPTTSSTLQSLNDGENQIDTFSYTIEDEYGAPDSAVVTIIVGGVYDEPSNLTIDSINPTTVTRGDTGVSIQVLGTGFSASSVVSLENGGGPSPTITNTSFDPISGWITITIDVPSKGPKTTAWDLRVIDGVNFDVLANALTIIK